MIFAQAKIAKEWKPTNSAIAFFASETNAKHTQGSLMFTSDTQHLTRTHHPPGTNLSFVFKVVMLARWQLSNQHRLAALHLFDRCLSITHCVLEFEKPSLAKTLITQALPTHRLLAEYLHSVTMKKARQNAIIPIIMTAIAVFHLITADIAWSECSPITQGDAADVEACMQCCSNKHTKN